MTSQVIPQATIPDVKHVGLSMGEPMAVSLCQLTEFLSDPPPCVHDWVADACSVLGEQLNGEISASVWTYCVGRTEYLCCAFVDEAGTGWTITFFAAGTLNLSGPVDEPDTTDLAEALHLVALLVKALGVTTTFLRAVHL